MLLAYNEEMKRKLEPFRDHMRETLPQRSASWSLPPPLSPPPRRSPCIGLPPPLLALRHAPLSSSPLPLCSLTFHRQISNGSSFDSNLLSRSDQDKPSLVTNEVTTPRPRRPCA
eukprot:511932-Hanusia_phi.AAC.1